MSCQGCSQIFHAECSRTNFEYDHMQDKWSCWQCTANKPKVYNPFNTLVYDKYAPNNLDDIDDIRIISSVLESCAMYDSTQFNSMVKNFRPDHDCQISKFSILFNNIDGNASNFDSFLSEISQYKLPFSIIAIAETNIDEENSDLYKISNYSSEYNSKFPNKRKGSGLGMYIHEEFQCNRIEKLKSNKM